MNATRLLGALCATILASSIGTSLVACAAPEKEEAVTTAQATSAASVSIALLDSNGNKVGAASGTLIAPRLVLTAGHAISGKGKWEITSADGKTKVTGSRGMTYDWMTYDSTKAHPRRHDVGVIHLDAPIKLDAYPKLVGHKPAAGLEATRIRNTGAKFDHVSVFLSKVKTSPNNLLGDMKGGETLDTGGAVYSDEGIIGVVSGRGMTTGKVYVARTDKLGSWLSAKVACAGGATKATFAAGADKSKEICDENGNPIGQNASSSSGGPGAEGSSPSSGGDTGGSCEDNNDGVCSGACGGSYKVAPNGGPNGSGGDGSGSGAGGDNGGSDSSEGSSGSSGSNPNQGDNGGPNGNTDGSKSGSGGPGAGSDGDGDGKGGSSGSNPNQGDGPNAGGGASGSGTAGGGDHGKSGGAGGAVDDEESCQGPSDNPEVCPPEPDGCSGSQCGGGNPDENISYGACGCEGSSAGTDIDVR